MDLIRIGRIGRPHGVRGEVTLDAGALSEADLEAIGEFEWRGLGGARRSLKLQRVRPALPRMLATFHGIDDREQAAALTNGELFADRGRIPDAGPGQAYWFELVGLAVIDGSGRTLGRVAEVLGHTGQPVYRVQGEREILIPAVEPIVRRVDLDAGTILVDLPEGLEEL